MAKWAARLPQGCAIFGVNDFTAGEVRQALAASGRTVPESATLIGVDGVGEFPASPGSDEVSSVQIDFERAGYIAARLLARLVDAGFSSQHCDGMVREPATEVFGPLLVLRRPSTRGRFKPSPVVAGAVEIIRREASAGLTAKALAARMPGSRKHFERRFREAMGHSVLEEILHTRLEAVQTMLRRPDAPIGIVSSACGFGSDIELKRLFKRRTGMSMRQWRARFVN
jgi:LacI family transcriptional regulator